jgi:hypothetical protein
VLRYAMTAAVQSAGQRTRLLVGLDANAPVLGRRLWSRPRAAVAGAGVTTALCLLAVGFTLPVALPGPAGTEAPALAAAVPPGAGGPPEAAPTQRGSPPDAEPRLGRIDLPPLAPAIDGDVSAAARHARASGLPAPNGASEAAASLPPPVARLPAETLKATPDETPEDAPKKVPAVAAVPSDAFWAVTTRLLRTRAESQQWLQALDELLSEQGSAKLQVELLSEGADWRVVGWPFTRRADAERARALLLARGLKVEVVDF